jgi:hypothetical protein
MQSWDAFARAEPDMAETGRRLLHQRGDGEGFLATVAKHGTPRMHVLNVGIRDGRLLVFIQERSAKARDLENNPRYALHAHVDPAQPHEFLVRGVAQRVTEPGVRQAAASDWFFRVSETYPLYELQIEHVLLGERASPNDWPPRYRSWRSPRSAGVVNRPD